MKILLAADGSAFTRIAAQHLVNHIEWFAKVPEIHIVHVHPPMPYPGAAARAGKAAVAKYHREESEGALAVAEKVLVKAGLAYISYWLVGEVARELATYARARDIDLVVMGSHGHGALASLALGSVATKCIATLEVPIMIVRKAPRRKSPPKSAL
ncbi:MAG: universal stress protein [Betaproteobacteria bacterium]|nr:universal stress protein [Betaproteobacteria bacterium]